MIAKFILNVIKLYFPMNKVFTLNYFSFLFDKFSNYLVLLFVFFMPIYPYLGKKIILSIFILWMFKINFKQLSIEIYKNNFIFFITIFMLLISFSILWSDNIKTALKINEVIYIYFFFPLIALYFVIKKDFLQLIFLTFMFSMFLNAIFSYMILFNISDNIFGYHFNGTKENLVPFQASHMTYSAYLAFTLLLSIYYIFKNANIYMKIINIIYSILLLNLLFASTGRTGQLIFILTTIIIIIVYFRKNIRYFLLGLILLSLTIFGFYLLNNNFKERINIGISDISNIVNSNNYSSSLGVRLLAYKIIPEVVNENVSILFTGVGIGDSQDIVEKKHFKYLNEIFRYQKGQLHNTFFTIFVALGSVGIILFLYIIFLLFKININDPLINYMRYIFLSTFIICALSFEIFGQKEIMFFFSLFSSIILFETKKESISRLMS